MNAIADGLKLQEILKLKKLKPPQLAEMINVNRSQVNHWMNDISISDANKQKITEATGIEFDTVAVPYNLVSSARLSLVAILIFLAVASIGFYFWLSFFGAPVIVSQPVDAEAFHKIYDPLPDAMKKEEATALGLYQNFTAEDKKLFPVALKNYLEYEKCQATSRGQKQLAVGWLCKDKNFFADGSCSFRNYINPRVCPTPISIVRGIE